MNLNRPGATPPAANDAPTDTPPARRLSRFAPSPFEDAPSDQASTPEHAPAHASPSDAPPPLAPRRGLPANLTPVAPEVMLYRTDQRPDYAHAPHNQMLSEQTGPVDLARAFSSLSVEVGSIHSGGTQRTIHFDDRPPTQSPLFPSLDSPRAGAAQAPAGQAETRGALLDRIDGLPDSPLQLPRQFAIRFDRSAALVGSFREPARPDLHRASQAWFERARQLDLPHEAWDTQTLESLRTRGNTDALAHFLERLTGTADYQHPLSRPGFTRRVVGLLTDCARSPALFDTCAAMSIEALESCDDRIALSLSKMVEAARAQRSLNEATPRETIIETGRILWRTHMVETLARDHAKAKDVRDVIEVELAFRVKLAERLGLPDQHEHMLFDNPSLHKIEPADLDAAAERIRTLEQSEPPAMPPATDEPNWEAHLTRAPDPHPVARYFAEHYPAWQAHMKRHDAHFDAHQTALTARMHDALDTLGEWLEKGDINELDYTLACQVAQFHALHGIAYTHALRALTAEQHNDAS